VEFNPENIVVKRCAEGMSLEGAGKTAEAAQVFWQAWREATLDLEKFISAHYVARHQKNVADKLAWDKTALAFALKIKEENMKAHLPSLYLNIAKCHEDMGDGEEAKKNYFLAQDFSEHLTDDGYGQMTKAGIARGMERISCAHSKTPEGCTDV
jgi:hypothetical protein